jgi:transposase
MTRPTGSAEELERRRRRAVELVEQGESPTIVARILGVHETSIHRWRRLARTEAGLGAKPHLGPTPRLSDQQLSQLETLLLEGAEKHGWPNNLWTADRVAYLIDRHFGVAYHPEHVRKILKHRLDWTSQKPQKRAREQNEKEVERWKDDEFPRILRDAWRREAHLIFLDEAGFMLTPTVRRTLAPRGQTPIIKALQRHDRISTISCVTLGAKDDRPGLYFELLPEGLNVKAEDIVAFLRQLRLELPGPWTVVWDRHNIHSRARLVKDWLAGEPDVVLEDLPAYAPALNPDEMVWAWLKYGRLCNLTPQDIAQLRDHLLTELDWAAFDGELLSGFFNHADLGVHLSYTGIDSA